MELALVLWDSIEAQDSEISDEEAAWVAELDQRFADFKTDRSSAEPVEKVFAEVREEAVREQQSR